MYTPKYTTRDRIAQQLDGQVSVYSTSSVGGQAVTLDELDYYIEQEEALVDLILGQIYELPLQNPQPVVSMIVEDKVKRRVLKTVPNQMIDLGGQQQMFVAGAAEYLLSLLTAGHNIQIPGVPPAQAIPGYTTPQPIVLVGETLARRAPDTITRSETLLYTRKTTVENGGFYWGDGIGDVNSTRRSPEAWW